MQMDFLRKLKLILYFIAMAAVLFFGYLSKKTGENIKMMFIALVILLVCAGIFKLAQKRVQNKKEVSGDKTN